MNTSDTKNKILDTAERLFARQGIGATSLRAIVREAGL
ncbi:MAG TPA: TetR/AcrR family transcriptional regulator, partial [Caldithrix abyssi]|nr:TetR/AcrR family transcriptional regulator [Caldithrix abyssi]